MKLDTLTLVETPEGVDLHAHTVGLVPRALAYTIDFCIRGGVVMIFWLIMLFLGEGGQGLALIVYFLLEWLYPVAFEVWRNGQTIGKQALSIKVVNQDLTPVQLGPSLTRNLLRVADFLPIFFTIGVVSMLSTAKFQRLGDLAANTLVISATQQKPEPINLDEVQATAPSFTLSHSQQQAFISFALNRGGLSQARQMEVASIIAPWVANRHDDPVAYVKGVGKWLLGAR